MNTIIYIFFLGLHVQVNIVTSSVRAKVTGKRCRHTVGRKGQRRGTSRRRQGGRAVIAVNNISTVVHAALSGERGSNKTVAVVHAALQKRRSPRLGHPPRKEELAKSTAVPSRPRGGQWTRRIAAAR